MDNKIKGQECEFYNEGHCLCYSDESHYPHCLEYPNCYYKQLLAEQAKNAELNGELVNKNQQLFKEQAKNKKLVEALELALSDTCYDAKTCEYKCQFAILNQCDLFKAGQALNEVNK